MATDEEQHKVRVATREEHKLYCDCADRYPIYIDYVCSCGEKRCMTGMQHHIFGLHLVK